MKKIRLALLEYFRLADKWLLFLWIGASVLAVIFQQGLFEAGMTSADRGDREVKMMITASLVGLVAATIISLIDYHLLIKLWKLYMPLCLILVLMTPFIGTVVGDNQAWLTIRLGSFRFSIQPSEFLKISFIMTFSLHIAKVRDNLNRLSNVLLLCLHGAVHFFLIQALQNDTGSSLVFLGIFIVMIFCAGINWRYIAVAFAGIAAAAPLLWFRILSEDQKMRILILFSPDLSPDYAYQQSRALKAMAYGGMQGQGIFNADHNYVYVPKAYNDLIFSFIGEACGFVGCLGIIVLLSAIACKILYNSHYVRDNEGRFICIGIFAMISTQIVINIGMCLGVLPVIGVTLPLFSAGGSSVLSLYAALGLALSIYRHSRQTIFFEREE